MIRALLVGIIAVAMLCGCQSSTGVGTSPATSNATAGIVGPCHERTVLDRILPDQTCTPGATNPAVNQSNISSTICRTGWATTVRPPVAYTDRIKRESIAAYGLPAHTAGELDHLIPLELGGNPTDVRNLWIEPGPIPNPKDAVEDALHQAVCAGRVPLAAAQAAIAYNWASAETQVGIATP